jgi:hypothetical protein
MIAIQNSTSLQSNDHKHVVPYNTHIDSNGNHKLTKKNKIVISDWLAT